MAKFVIAKEGSTFSPRALPYRRGGGYFPSLSGHKMREQARLGFGEPASVIAAANRLFRVGSEIAPAQRHVITIEDVTKGLGIDDADSQRIQNLVQGARPERLLHARGALLETLRGMKHIEADIRMEVMRRSIAWWKKSWQTDYGKEPTVSYIVPVTKSLSKGGPYIGPKGGKWADAKHTIPWKEEHHGKGHHKVSVVSVDRWRSKGQTHTKFRIHDPHMPEGKQDHYYTIGGGTPASRKKQALEQHQERHQIGPTVRAEGSRAQREAGARRRGFKDVKGGVAGGKVKIAGVGGKVGEVDVHAVHGNYAVHRVDGKDWAVTHVPTGMRLPAPSSKKGASDYARHMHEHAPSASGDFGKRPNEAAMRELIAAHKIFKKSLRLVYVPPRYRRKRIEF